MSVVLSSRAPLLTKQRVEVTSDVPGMVRLTVGNSHLDMEYGLALSLSAWLRVHGANAKAKAGDTSPLVTAVGILENADG
jgi:hypothetical protein